MTGHAHRRNGAAYPAEAICVLLACDRVTPAQLAEAVLAAAAAVLSDRHLDPSVLPKAAILERPKNPDHGDYASALALQMARKAGVPAHELAQAMADKLSTDAAIQSAHVAGGGFLNIWLQSSATGAVAGTVIEQGASLRTRHETRGSAGEPGVCLSQPDRSDPRWRIEVGRGGRRACPAAACGGRGSHHGVLLQRRWRAD